MPPHLPPLLIAAALLSLGGCASTSSSTRTEPSTQAQASTAAPRHERCGMCPMGVEGVQVSASEVEGGAALTFTTSTGDVGALRARVARMAERHNARHAMASSPGQGPCCQQGAPNEAQAACPHGKGSCPEGQCPKGGPAGAHAEGCPGHHGQHAAMSKAMGAEMHSARATVEEVPGGARLVLAPADASRLTPLREQVRHHAEAMAQGRCDCPMMQGGHAARGHAH